ncbi:hypothetical protein FSG55_013345 [Escherichia coli]|nr:hypothetical protein [Escherichia coli O157:H7]EKB8112748.1 hypothetical protein [Escherichia coli]ELT2129250.1 hypothetical protein [Escherichia coli]MBC0797809.1 hypothetical protein [Escherichia coli]HAH8728957.1 hypothetical protein [Escherichia coli]
MDEIDALTRQYQILEEEAQRFTGEKRAEFFKAAAKVKQRIVNRLNEQASRKQAQPEQQQQGPQTPDIESYFQGDFLDRSMQEYFSDSLPPEMERYFVSGDAFENAPSMPIQQIEQSTADKQAEEEAERKALRMRIMHAAGVFAGK